jgi:hypothetical protein
MDQLARIQKRRGHDVYMAFLDIWAAYDTVNRDILWDKCRGRGIPEKLVRLLASLADKNQNAVIGDGQRSDWFYAAAGLGQGSAISPILYNIFINDLCVALEARGLGVKTAQQTVVPGALFADDVGLIATTAADLQRMVDVCVEHSRQNVYRWKPAKSIVVSDRQSNIEIYGIQLERNRCFTYLGVPLTTQGIDASRLVARLVAASTAALQVMQMVGINAYGFKPYRACLAYKAFIRSTLEYGVAITALDKKQIEQLERAQNRALRKVLGGYRSSSIEVLRQLAEVEPIAMRVQELQVRRLVGAIQTGSEEQALVGTVLSDCLQDHGSTVRQIMRNNPLWAATWDGRPAGVQLPVLWSQAERAAVQFGRVNGRPWQHAADGSFPDCTDVDTRAVAKLYKQAQRELRWAQAVEKGSGIQARDLPPTIRETLRSPLKQLRCDMVDRRLLLNWWLNGIPSHRTGMICHVCQQIIPHHGGGRLHVANCAVMHGVAGLDQFQELGRFAAYAVDGTAQDPITRQIWLCALHKQWKQGMPYFDTMIRALHVVVEKCLGRIEGGGNARHHDAQGVG